MPTPTHHPIGDPIDAAARLLAPSVRDIVLRINVDEFTTPEFIEALQLDDDARAAYEAAIRAWPEPDPEIAKMIIHGQVVPQLLRDTGLVEWAGFAHGVPDPYAVPAWWRRIDAS